MLESLVANLIYGVKKLNSFFVKIFLNRSTKNLNRYSKKDIDMFIFNNEKTRDDFEEFVRIIPDECLIDLGNKVYFQK